MLNIISRAIDCPNAGAVHKVAVTLIKSLKACGIEYVVNKELSFCSKVLILDDYRALASIKKLDNRRKVIVGPNLFALPRDIPSILDIPNDVVFIQPSQIVNDQWSELGFSKYRMAVWPVAIDIPDIYKRENPESVLLYHKSRDVPGDMKSIYIEKLLESKNIDFVRFDSGRYNQDDFLKQLSQTKYVIWLGCKETQGLALQEALAMGCPIIVIEPRGLGDDDRSGYIWSDQESDLYASSAPYFSDECGIKISELYELEGAIDLMEESYSEYVPTNFIKNNLSHQASVNYLLNIYGKFWDFEDRKVSFEGVGLSWVWWWPLIAIELRVRTRWRRWMYKCTDLFYSLFRVFR